MTKEELMQALGQNGSASSVLMKEMLAIVEAEIQEAAKPAKPLLITSLSATLDYSRHEMAMPLGITEEQLMQILRGEIVAVTDNHSTLYLAYVRRTDEVYEAAFGAASPDFGILVKFSGDTNTNTYNIKQS